MGTKNERGGVQAQSMSLGVFEVGSERRILLEALVAKADIIAGLATHQYGLLSLLDFRIILLGEI